MKSLTLKTIVFPLILSAFLCCILADCKKKVVEDEIPDDIPVNDEYTITVECLDMTSLSGDEFVDKLVVDDARVIVNGQLMSQGEYSFQYKGHTVTLDYTGSVHDTILCVRKPEGNSNLYQTQNSNPAQINLQYIGQANDIHLELYKIPNWVNIDWVKEALALHTAVYTHDVIVYLKNEEYTDQELPAAKQSAINHINNVLPQINPCTTGITAILDVNADSGDLKVRLGKSFNYINPGAGVILNNGIIDNSFIKISANPFEVYYYLAELYHAIGVRVDIGFSIPSDGRIADEISDDTDKLNRFGKALMRINYFLDPDTHL